MSSACPVPTATTRTSMPLSFLNAGSRWPNKPDCSVEVVEATTMDLSWASAAPVGTRAKAASTMQAMRRWFMMMERFRGPHFGQHQRQNAI
jgi:hypothetical protein